MTEAQEMLDRVRADPPPTHEDAVTGMLFVIALALVDIADQLRGINESHQTVAREL